MSRAPWWVPAGIAVASGAAVAALGSSASSSVRPGGPNLPAGQCQTVTVAQTTRSGHEADVPVRVCGLGLAGPATCRVVKGTFGQSAERWRCS